MSLERTIRLTNGVEMPRVHLGVFNVSDEEAERTVAVALETGYRAVDTASLYRNEVGVGRAVRASGIERERLFITSKLWNDEHGYEQALAGFEASRKRLGLEYLDLYLIHWPVPGKFPETWRALQQLYRDGRVRSIGVSNFQIHHLQALRNSAENKPMVNQVEFHPFIYSEQRDLLEYCAVHQIVVQAWAPLARARRFDDPAIRQVATAHGRTPAQVMLRWALQHEVVVLPKSTNPERISANAAVWDFELTPAEMRALDGISDGVRVGPHPDTFLSS